MTEAVQRLVDEGIEAARSGRQAEALSLMDQALAIDEDNIEALLWRGGLSTPDEALSFLERAYAIDPTNERAREGLEWARQRAGLSPQATVPTTAPPETTRGGTARSVHRGMTGSRRIYAAGRPPRATSAGVIGVMAEALAFLVSRPTVALMMSVLLLGLLGTAAVARAGMSRADSLAAPTPQVVVGDKRTAPVVVAAKPSPTVAPTTTAKTTAAPTAVAAKSAPMPTPAAPPVVSAVALDQAWAASDWPQAILIIQEMLKRTPGDAQLTKKLFTAYFNNGVQLVRSEKLAEAIAEFDKALAIDANSLEAQSERQFAELYLQGSTALAQGDYGMAVRPLRTIFEGNPNYRSVKSRLYQAYVGYADSLEQEGKRADAYTYYQKASRIDPQGTEAQAGMTRVKDAVPDSVLAAANKKIEVDLANQRVIVWENDKVIYRFKASTGKSPHGTRTGHFEILNKMPNAYSSALGWGMPYWMGIYQAGGTENGFHGMARLANGSVMPTSTLGRPATYGCIMLSDADARTLYNWASIGTYVWIH